MNDFGDRLHENLAQKEAAVRHAAQAAEQAQQAARKQFAEADLQTAALVADVLRPLLAEFQRVMEADGLFCRGRGAIKHVHPAAARPDFGRQRLIYTARGTAAGRPLYEIRLTADLGRSDLGRSELGGTGLGQTSAGGMAIELPLELTAECLHGAPPSYLRQSPPQPLVELPRQSLLATAIDAEAARQWCEEILKQCAAAITQAVFGQGAPSREQGVTTGSKLQAPSSPLCAPVTAFPLDAMPVTM